VEGRTADAAYWLALAAPAWRDAVRVAAIDMCTMYASAVRRLLPGAQQTARPERQPSCGKRHGTLPASPSFAAATPAYYRDPPSTAPAPPFPRSQAT
jgi:hypothetical protein